MKPQIRDSFAEKLDGPWPVVGFNFPNVILRTDRGDRTYNMDMVRGTHLLPNPLPEKMYDGRYPTVVPPAVPPKPLPVSVTPSVAVRGNLRSLVYDMKVDDKALGPYSSSTLPVDYASEHLPTGAALQSTHLPVDTSTHLPVEAQRSVSSESVLTGERSGDTTETKALFTRYGRRVKPPERYSS